MGRAHSKRRAGRDTYHRSFTGILCRPPKGRRWTKPSKIVEALELLAIKEGAIGLAPLLAYARECQDRLDVRPLKRGQDFPGRMPRGNKGNVFLEYAWAKFNRSGAILSEQDIMADHLAGKVTRWYDSLTPPDRQRVKVEKVSKVRNPKAFKRSMKKAAKAAESQAASAKRVGDKFRAEIRERNNRRDEFASQYRAEQKLLESFKAMLSE